MPHSYGRTFPIASLKVKKTDSVYPKQATLVIENKQNGTFQIRARAKCKR